MSEIAINVTNLDVKIGKKQILSDMSLEIAKGEIFGLIGPSGAGKTTLVKTIIGMEKGTNGTTEVLGKVMPNLPVISKIGYMAQSDALYTDLTAKENLDFFASLYSIKGAAKKDRMNYAATLVNLQQDLTKKVNNYSGGMKRRLSLPFLYLLTQMS